GRISIRGICVSLLHEGSSSYWKRRRCVGGKMASSAYRSFSFRVMANFLIAELYKFVELPDFRELQQPLFDFCESQGVKGTLLLAEEGVNGTTAGPQAGIRAVLDRLRQGRRLAALEHTASW